MTMFNEAELIRQLEEQRAVIVSIGMTRRLANCAESVRING
jgi:hypothetical protein